MSTIIPAYSVVWQGVYKKVVVFGRLSRILMTVVSDHRSAEEWIANELKTKSWLKAENFMIEDVDIKMRKWKIA